MFKIIKFFFVFVLCACAIVMSVFYGFSSLFAPKDMDQRLIPDAASQILDSKGKVIHTTQSKEKRVPVDLQKIPVKVRNAFIAIEDNRFYEHGGIDIRGTARAIVSTLSGREVQGGSTITQQLAKNAFLSQDRTLKRKINEAFYARELERKYTKDEILSFYLNRIYFGHGTYGIESASYFYFGKHVDQLSLAEAATLAAIPKSPNYYNPIANPKESDARKNLVLDQMVKYNMLKPEEAEAAKKVKVVLDKGTGSSNFDYRGYIFDMVLQQTTEKLSDIDPYTSGLKIYTTIDSDMQEQAEKALRHLDNYSKYVDGKKLTQPQVALAAVEPTTGHIKALIGGRGQDKFNRAYLATRQPGSSFKPFVYLTAMQNGMTPATVIEDKQEDFGGGFKPFNSDMQEHGKVSLRTALSRSLNIPTAKIAQMVGPEKIVENAVKMGISTLVDSGKYNDYNLSMALGGLSHGVTPLEMAAAYGVFATNGMYTKPIIISKILDRDGKVIFEAKPKLQQVLSPGPCYLVTNMLQDVLVSGTAGGMGIGRPAAGKTGTTDNYNDAWFVGFTPNLSTAVWVGDDNNQSIHMYGSGAPLDIWHQFMLNAHSGLPWAGFSNPGVAVPAEPVIPKEDDKDKDKDKKDGKNKDGKPGVSSGSSNSGSSNSGEVTTKPKKSLKDRLRIITGGKPKSKE